MAAGGQAVLISAADSRGGTPVLTIHVYNRGREPIYLQTVGLQARGGRAIPIQRAEMRQLPTKLDPSDGFPLVADPASLVQALADFRSSVDRFDRVYCVDGAGRMYVRRLKPKEREAIRSAARAATGRG